MTTANVFCRQLMRVAVAHGVATAYCSPGSRNAPLLIAADAQPELTTRVVIDERAAAFMALGEALVSRKPVMLICTSGSALLNYAPAVAEAYYAGVPLIVVSADRPFEWIDQADSQTINQYGALSNIVLGSYDIPVWSEEGNSRHKSEEWYVERSANEAMLRALGRPNGPVHINFQLDTPLGKMTSRLLEEPRLIEKITDRGLIDDSTLKRLVEIGSGSKILLLAGFMSPDHKLRRAVLNLSSLPNVCVMAETLSNLSPSSRNNYWACIDSAIKNLDDRQLEALRPDLVISIGGAIVSKCVKSWLRRFPPSSHWHIGFPTTRLADTFQSLTLKIEAAEAPFINRFASLLKRTSNSDSDSSDYALAWQDIRERATAILNQSLDEIPSDDSISELSAIKAIGKAFPKDANLFLSNGMAVRYEQLFPIFSHATYCNRGVSGIDGCTSTAIGGGIAYASRVPEWPAVKGVTVLISGDMSFAYDLGGLASGLMPEGMKFIIINNNGGGIFRKIESTASLPENIREKYFCVKPFVSPRMLAEAFGLEFWSVDSFSSLDDLLNRFFSSTDTAVMEIRVE